ncbi:hypothetical protein [Cyanobium sp. Morenito 9A2]|nr:hypothetical protein [Cyanobium sp. Morenito 9A2]
MVSRWANRKANKVVGFDSRLTQVDPAILAVVIKRRECSSLPVTP